MLAAEFEAAGEKVLEVRVHGEDIPAIVVVRPESMYSLHARAFYPGGAELAPGARARQVHSCIVPSGTLAAVLIASRHSHRPALVCVMRIRRAFAAANVSAHMRRENSWLH